jgi:hypothetical protein
MLMNVYVGAIILALSTLPAHALDDGEFCADMTEQARTGQLEAAVWLDENTREETVNVRCPMRMIEFRRHLDMPSSDLTDEWRQREKNRWNEAHCSDPLWREAIRAGWTIASTLITTTGERIWFTARCR